MMVPLLMALLVSCTSETRCWPKKVALVSGLQILQAKHAPVTDADLVAAFNLDMTKFLKKCWIGTCEFYLQPAFLQSTARSDKDQSLREANINFFTESDKHGGWVSGHEVVLSFNRDYCISAAEFKTISHMDYIFKPSQISADIATISEFVFRNNSGYNLVSLSMGCNQKAIAKVYFTKASN